MKAPISMCVIVKNEPFLEKCILSFRNYVEELVIVDTGSTDHTTVEVAKKYADVFEIFTACNDPSTGLIEDFAMARNRAFELANQKFVAWVDGDDIIEGCENFSKIIDDFEKSSNLGEVSFLFPYEYSYNAEGQCTLKHYRERLFSNKNAFIFVNPVHECCIIQENFKASLITRDDIVWKHQRQYIPKQMEPGRNLRILKRYYEKVGDSDARQLYYLGLEYSNCGMIDESIKCLIKYINLSGWEDEKVMACLKLVDIYQMLNNLEEALIWAFKAIEVKENWSEGYFALGKLFYFLALKGGPNEIRFWQKCVYFIETGFKLPPTQTLLFINPLDRECEIYKYLNLAQNKLGDVKGALQSVNIGIQKQPADPNFVLNKKLYEEFLARQNIVENANVLKNNSTIAQNDVEAISAIINNLSVESNKPPREQIISSLNKLKDAGELSGFVVGLLVSLINKQINPDKFFSDVFTPNSQSSLTSDGRSIANISTNKDVWSIPVNTDIYTPPLSMNNEQLQSVVLAVWKQYMVNNEILSAINFLENLPVEVRYLPIIEKALFTTKEHIGNTNNDNKIVIDGDLSNTDAAKQLQHSSRLMKLTPWDIFNHFKKEGHNIKNCYMKDDGSIYVEGYINAR